MPEPKNPPTFDKDTGVITVYEVKGVQWKVNGEEVNPGAQPALEVDETAEVTAHAQKGYNLVGENTWTFTRSVESE